MSNQKRQSKVTTAILVMAGVVLLWLLLCWLAAEMGWITLNRDPLVTASATPSPTWTRIPLRPTATRTPGSPYADKVVAVQQGPGAYAGQFSDPAVVLGPPDVVANPCCTGMFSLGTGGSITVAFTDNTVIDGPGPDLRVWGDATNDENVIIEVSPDGRTWKSFGPLREVATLDLQTIGLELVRYVRITDDAIPEPSGNNSAEVDAVEALHSGSP